MAYCLSSVEEVQAVGTFLGDMDEGSFSSFEQLAQKRKPCQINAIVLTVNPEDSGVLCTGAHIASPQDWARIVSESLISGRSAPHVYAVDAVKYTAP